MRYRLRALRINWAKIDEYLFTDLMIEKGASTFGELKINL